MIFGETLMFERTSRGRQMKINLEKCLNYPFKSQKVNIKVKTGGYPFWTISYPFWTISYPFWAISYPFWTISYLLWTISPVLDYFVQNG